MDSLQERLREQADEQEDERIIRMGREPWLTDREAADELDRLGAQVEELKASVATMQGLCAGWEKMCEGEANRGDAAVAELAALKHDIERQITSEQATQIEALRRALEVLLSEISYPSEQWSIGSGVDLARAALAAPEAKG